MNTESGFLTIIQLHLNAVLKFMIKMPYYKENINHGQNTRNATQNNVTRSIARHTVCQNHIYSVGPKVYNILPAVIRSKPYPMCKKDIKDWILQSRYEINFVI